MAILHTIFCILQCLQTRITCVFEVSINYLSGQHTYYKCTLAHVSSDLRFYTWLGFTIMQILIHIYH